MSAIPNRVRSAVPDDVAAILTMFQHLADSEGTPHAVTNTTADLADQLFGQTPMTRVEVIDDVVDGRLQVVGVASWYPTYSTWQGTYGIWLEDLIVDPAVRGRGHGRQLVLALARIATHTGYHHIEWSVRDWNSRAKMFYQSLGAKPVPGLTTYRLDGAALDAAGQP